MMIRSINSEILDNDTTISLKNLFFIKGKIKLIKLSSVCLMHATGEVNFLNYLGDNYFIN